MAKRIRKPQETNPAKLNAIYKEKKRKRKARKKKEIVICETERCWFKGPCLHRDPHPLSEKCEKGFCSVMSLNTGCKKVKE